MPKNIDTRDFSYRRASDNFAAAAKISTDLPGNHQVKVERVNPFTGSTVNLRSINAGSMFAAVAGAGPTDASLIDRALEHIRVAATALGFAPTDVPEFVPDPYVKETSTGGRVVNLQQQYRGIPVFQMERAVLFDHTGAIQSVTGTSVGDLPDDLETLPAVLVEDAALAMANYLATPSVFKDSWTKEEVEIESPLVVKDYAPKVLGRVSSPPQPIVLDKGPFAENIPAHLVFFYQGQTTRLGWHFVVTLPDFTEQYAVIVEADSQTVDKKRPEIIYCQKTSSDMFKAVRANVWMHNPGVNTERRVVDFPRPLSDYPITPTPTDLPSGFPNSWLDGEPSTAGNNTIAVLGNTLNSLRGVLKDDVLTFDPSEAQGDEQKVLNIFYFCNFMHDFFFMLGFDEASGNFQKVNFSGTGRASDPVLARAHAGTVTGTANMLTRADGLQGLMNMGLVKGVNRHTAFDSDVVFHEFTHGVSNRLVGKNHDAISLQQPQSRGMGEGWSDYFALTIQNFFLDKEKTVTGDWVINNPAGIRTAPYDDDYPGTFGDIGKPGPYDGSDEHTIGEIWCAALMKMNRDLAQTFGSKERGYLLGWQIVVDGFKNTAANPSFLDARDGILQALEARAQRGLLSAADFKKARRAVWGAFARFGMGPNASSVGASLFGIVEDGNIPPGL